MKKTIAILLVMAIALTSVFAATTSSTSSMTLSTEVDTTYDVKIVAGASATWDKTGVTEPQDITTTEADYTALVRTNEVKHATLSLTAKPLKSKENNCLSYEVTIDGADAFIVEDGESDGHNLITSGDDTGSGLRVLPKEFSVKLSAEKREGAANNVFAKKDAPAGTYEGTITINYKGV